MEGLVRAARPRGPVRGILQRGGTILGTSRRDPYVHGEGGVERCRDFEAERLDALVVDRRRRHARAARSSPRGGLPGRRRAEDDRQRHPRHRRRRSASTPPCTIATEAIDRITTTAESHDRVMVVEVMGRTCGWIATYAGIAARRRRDPRPGAADTTSRRPAASSCSARARARTSRSSSSPRVCAADASGERRLVAPGSDAFGSERLGGVGDASSRELEG